MTTCGELTPLRMQHDQRQELSDQARREMLPTARCWPGADVDGEALESKKSAMTFPIAPAIALLAYTVLSFVLAVKASGIMAALKGSEWETQLEEITAPKASWRGVSSITGYNPLNQRLWWAIARLSDLPDGVRPKVKSLKTLLVVQSVVFIATVALAVAWLFGV